MRVSVIIETSAELESLYEWLVRDPELRGQVSPKLAAPKSGKLGAVLESLIVVLGPGGVATALASVLISWLRRRVGEVHMKITVDDTSVEIDGKNFRDMDAKGFQRLIDDIVELLRRDGN